MPASATLTSVVIPASGPIVVNYSDSTASEYPDRAAIVSAVTDFAGNLNAADAPKRFLLARWYALNPALDDPGQINGTVCEVNWGSTLNPVAFGSV